MMISSLRQPGKDEMSAREEPPALRLLFFSPDVCFRSSIPSSPLAKEASVADPCPPRRSLCLPPSSSSFSSPLSPQPLSFFSSSLPKRPPLEPSAIPWSREGGRMSHCTGARPFSSSVSSSSLGTSASSGSECSLGVEERLQECEREGRGEGKRKDDEEAKGRAESGLVQKKTSEGRSGWVLSWEEEAKERQEGVHEVEEEKREKEEHRDHRGEGTSAANTPASMFSSCASTGGSLRGTTMKKSGEENLQEKENRVSSSNISDSRRESLSSSSSVMEEKHHLNSLPCPGDLRPPRPSDQDLHVSLSARHHQHSPSQKDRNLSGGQGREEEDEEDERNLGRAALEKRRGFSSEAKEEVASASPGPCPRPRVRLAGRAEEVAIDKDIDDKDRDPSVSFLSSSPFFLSSSRAPSNWQDEREREDEKMKETAETRRTTTGGRTETTESGPSTGMREEEVTEVSSSVPSSSFSLSAGRQESEEDRDESSWREGTEFKRRPADHEGLGETFPSGTAPAVGEGPLCPVFAISTDACEGEEKRGDANEERRTSVDQAPVESPKEAVCRVEVSMVELGADVKKKKKENCAKTEEQNGESGGSTEYCGDPVQQDLSDAVCSEGSFSPSVLNQTPPPCSSAKEAEEVLGSSFSSSSSSSSRSSLSPREEEGMRKESSVSSRVHPPALQARETTGAEDSFSVSASSASSSVSSSTRTSTSGTSGSECVQCKRARRGRRLVGAGTEDSSRSVSSSSSASCGPRQTDEDVPGEEEEEDLVEQLRQLSFDLLHAVSFLRPFGRAPSLLPSFVMARKRGVGGEEEGEKHQAGVSSSMVLSVEDETVRRVSSEVVTACEESRSITRPVEIFTGCEDDSAKSGGRREEREEEEEGGEDEKGRFQAVSSGRTEVRLGSSWLASSCSDKVGDREEESGIGDCERDGGGREGVVGEEGGRDWDAGGRQVEEKKSEGGGRATQSPGVCTSKGGEERSERKERIGASFVDVCSKERSDGDSRPREARDTRREGERKEEELEEESLKEEREKNNGKAEEEEEGETEKKKKKESSRDPGEEDNERGDAAASKRLRATRVSSNPVKGEEEDLNRGKVLSSSSTEATVDDLLLSSGGEELFPPPSVGRAGEEEDSEGLKNAHLASSGAGEGRDRKLGTSAEGGGNDEQPRLKQGVSGGDEQKEDWLSKRTGGSDGVAEDEGGGGGGKRLEMTKRETSTASGLEGSAAVVGEREGKSRRAENAEEGRARDEDRRETEHFFSTPGREVKHKKGEKEKKKEDEEEGEDSMVQVQPMLSSTSSSSRLEKKGVDEPGSSQEEMNSLSDEVAGRKEEKIGSGDERTKKKKRKREEGEAPDEDDDEAGPPSLPGPGGLMSLRCRRRRRSSSSAEDTSSSSPADIEKKRGLDLSVASELRRICPLYEAHASKLKSLTTPAELVAYLCRHFKPLITLLLQHIAKQAPSSSCSSSVADHQDSSAGERLSSDGPEARGSTEESSARKCDEDPDEVEGERRERGWRTQAKREESTAVLRHSATTPTKSPLTLPSVGEKTETSLSFFSSREEDEGEAAVKETEDLAERLQQSLPATVRSVGGILQILTDSDNRQMTSKALDEVCDALIEEEEEVEEKGGEGEGEGERMSGNTKGVVMMMRTPSSPFSLSTPLSLSPESSSSSSSTSVLPLKLLSCLSSTAEKDTLLCDPSRVAKATDISSSSFCFSSSSSFSPLSSSFAERLDTAIQQAPSPGEASKEETQRFPSVLGQPQPHEESAGAEKPPEGTDRGEECLPERSEEQVGKDGQRGRERPGKGNRRGVDPRTGTAPSLGACFEEKKENEEKAREVEESGVSRSRRYPQLVEEDGEEQKGLDWMAEQLSTPLDVFLSFEEQRMAVMKKMGVRRGGQEESDKEEEEDKGGGGSRERDDDEEAREVEKKKREEGRGDSVKGERNGGSSGVTAIPRKPSRTHDDFRYWSQRMGDGACGERHEDGEGRGRGGVGEGEGGGRGEEGCDRERRGVDCHGERIGVDDNRMERLHSAPSTRQCFVGFFPQRSSSSSLPSEVVAGRGGLFCTGEAMKEEADQEEKSCMRHSEGRDRVMWRERRKGGGGVDERGGEGGAEEVEQDDDAEAVEEKRRKKRRVVATRTALGASGKQKSFFFTGIKEERDFRNERSETSPHAVDCRARFEASASPTQRLSNCRGQHRRGGEREREEEDEEKEEEEAEEEDADDEGYETSGRRRQFMALVSQLVSLLQRRRASSRTPRRRAMSRRVDEQLILLKLLVEQLKQDRQEEEEEEEEDHDDDGNDAKRQGKGRGGGVIYYGDREEDEAYHRAVLQVGEERRGDDGSRASRSFSSFSTERLLQEEGAMSSFLPPPSLRPLSPSSSSLDKDLGKNADDRIVCPKAKKTSFPTSTRKAPSLSADFFDSNQLLSASSSLSSTHLVHQPGTPSSSSSSPPPLPLPPPLSLSKYDLAAGGVHTPPEGPIDMKTSGCFSGGTRGAGSKRPSISFSSSASSSSSRGGVLLGGGGGLVLDAESTTPSLPASSSSSSSSPPSRSSSTLVRSPISSFPSSPSSSFLPPPPASSSFVSAPSGAPVMREEKTLSSSSSSFSSLHRMSSNKGLQSSEKISSRLFSGAGKERTESFLSSSSFSSSSSAASSPSPSSSPSFTYGPNSSKSAEAEKKKPPHHHHHHRHLKGSSSGASSSLTTHLPPSVRPSSEPSSPRPPQHTPYLSESASAPPLALGVSISPSSVSLPSSSTTLPLSLKTAETADFHNQSRRPQRSREEDTAKHTRDEESASPSPSSLSSFLRARTGLTSSASSFAVACSQEGEKERDVNTPQVTLPRNPESREGNRKGREEEAEGGGGGGGQRSDALDGRRYWCKNDGSSGARGGESEPAREGGCFPSSSWSSSAFPLSQEDLLMLDLEELACGDPSVEGGGRATRADSGLLSSASIGDLLQQYIARIQREEGLDAAVNAAANLFLSASSPDDGPSSLPSLDFFSKSSSSSSPFLSSVLSALLLSSTSPSLFVSSEGEEGGGGGGLVAGADDGAEVAEGRRGRRDREPQERDKEEAEAAAEDGEERGGGVERGDRRQDDYEEKKLHSRQPLQSSSLPLPEHQTLFNSSALQGKATAPSVGRDAGRAVKIHSSDQAMRLGVKKEEDRAESDSYERGRERLEEEGEGGGAQHEREKRQRPEEEEEEKEDNIAQLRGGEEGEGDQGFPDTDLKSYGDVTSSSLRRERGERGTEGLSTERKKYHSAHLPQEYTNNPASSVSDLGEALVPGSLPRSSSSEISFLASRQPSLLSLHGDGSKRLDADQSKSSSEKNLPTHSAYRRGVGGEEARPPSLSYGKRLREEEGAEAQRRREAVAEDSPDGLHHTLSISSQSASPPPPLAVTSSDSREDLLRKPPGRRGGESERDQDEERRKLEEDFLLLQNVLATTISSSSSSSSSSCPSSSSSSCDVSSSDRIRTLLKKTLESVGLFSSSPSASATKKFEGCDLLLSPLPPAGYPQCTSLSASSFPPEPPSSSFFSSSSSSSGVGHPSTPSSSSSSSLMNSSGERKEGSTTTGLSSSSTLVFQSQAKRTSSSYSSSSSARRPSSRGDRGGGGESFPFDPAFSSSSSSCAPSPLLSVVESARAGSSESFASTSSARGMLLGEVALGGGGGEELYQKPPYVRVSPEGTDRSLLLPFGSSSPSAVYTPQQGEYSSPDHHRHHRPHSITTSTATTSGAPSASSFSSSTPFSGPSHHHLSPSSSSSASSRPSPPLPPPPSSSASHPAVASSVSCVSPKNSPKSSKIVGCGGLGGSECKCGNPLVSGCMYRSSVSGVVYDKSGQKWTARWNEDGRQHKRTFASAKYGFLNAKMKAEICRAEARERALANKQKSQHQHHPSPHSGGGGEETSKKGGGGGGGLGGSSASGAGGSSGAAKGEKRGLFLSSDLLREERAFSNSSHRRCVSAEVEESLPEASDCMTTRRSSSSASFNPTSSTSPGTLSRSLHHLTPQASPVVRDLTEGGAGGSAERETSETSHKKSRARGGTGGGERQDEDEGEGEQQEGGGGEGCWGVRGRREKEGESSRHQQNAEKTSSLASASSGLHEKKSSLFFSPGRKKTPGLSMPTCSQERGKEGALSVACSSGREEESQKGSEESADKTFVSTTSNSSPVHDDQNHSLGERQRHRGTGTRTMSGVCTPEKTLSKEMMFSSSLSDKSSEEDRHLKNRTKEQARTHQTSYLSSSSSEADHHQQVHQERCKSPTAGRGWEARSAKNAAETSGEEEKEGEGEGKVRGGGGGDRGEGREEEEEEQQERVFSEREKSSHPGEGGGGCGGSSKSSHSVSRGAHAGTSFSREKSSSSSSALRPPLRFSPNKRRRRGGGGDDDDDEEWRQEEAEEEEEEDDE